MCHKITINQKKGESPTLPVAAACHSKPKKWCRCNDSSKQCHCNQQQQLCINADNTTTTSTTKKLQQALLPLTLDTTKQKRWCCCNDSSKRLPLQLVVVDADTITTTRNTKKLKQALLPLTLKTTRYDKQFSSTTNHYNSIDNTNVQSSKYHRGGISLLQQYIIVHSQQHLCFINGILCSSTILSLVGQVHTNLVKIPPKWYAGWYGLLAKYHPYHSLSVVFLTNKLNQLKYFEMVVSVTEETLVHNS